MIILLACVVALLVGLALLALCALIGGARLEERHAHIDPALPTYQPDARPERWSDDTERHIATALAIGRPTEAQAIQQSIERSQAAIKSHLAARDELAKRRAGRL